MNFLPPLLPGRFLKRYKRFFAEIIAENGEILTAHCPNTGAMAGLLEEGCRVYISPSTNPKRALKYTLEMMESEGVWVGVNTQTPNQLVFEALKAQKILELAPYTAFKREVKYGTGSRIDLLLTGKNLPDCYVEVKNVHFKRGSTAFFPDAVTTRGQKHIEELMHMKSLGHRAVMFFVIQRDDVKDFDFADFVDPVYARLAHEAISKGVEIFAYTCAVNNGEIVLKNSSPLQHKGDPAVDIFFLF